MSETLRDFLKAHPEQRCEVRQVWGRTLIKACAVMQFVRWAHDRRRACPRLSNAVLELAEDMHPDHELDARHVLGLLGLK